MLTGSDHSFWREEKELDTEFDPEADPVEYEREEVKFTKACHAPLDEIIITHKGEISLCCLEWKRKHCFGSLHKHSMADILNSEKVQRIYKNLLRGKRTLDICKRCNCAR